MCVGRRRTKSHYPCCIGEPGVTLVLGIQTATTGQESAWLRDLRIHYMLGPDLKPVRWLQYTSCRADVGVPQKRQVPTKGGRVGKNFSSTKLTPMNQISVAAIERCSTITRNNGNTNINIKSLAEPQVRDQPYRGILNLRELLRNGLQCFVQSGIQGT